MSSNDPTNPFGVENPPAPRITHADAYTGAAVGAVGMWMDTALQMQATLVKQTIQQMHGAAGAQMAMMKSFMQANPWFRAWQRSVDEAYERWQFPSMAGVAYEQSKEVLDRQLQFLPPIVRSWVKYELIHDPRMQEMMHGQGVAAALEYIGSLFPGHGELYEEPYNHRLLTEDSHGNIRAVTAEEIDALFPRRSGENAQRDFPHVILTSSHARAEKLSDFTDITHGIEALARDSQGKPLNIAHVNGRISGAANNTLILFSCDTERNPFLNAATLMRRLDELERIAKTGEPDRYAHVSPGAKRLAKLMLRCMAQDPSQVDINDERPIAQSLSRLQLRARPELIAQHFQLIGYSKGGNVVSDAMRYLVDELNSVDLQLQEGQSVRNLVRNIACMSIAALEVPMQEQYKQHGVRRVSFNNEHDEISNHMHFDSSWADHKWTVQGVKENKGHDPKDALGTRDGKRGYVLDDPRVRRRIKEAFAPLYGKAAISSLSFDTTAVLGEGSRGVMLGTAPGTPDHLLMQYAPKICTVLTRAGLHGVELKQLDQRDRRAFVLTAREDIQTDAAAIRKLTAGFEKLRKETPGLLISDDIFENQLKGRAGGGRGGR